MPRIRLLLASLLALPVSLQAAGRIDLDSLCAPWQQVPVPAPDIGHAAADCDAAKLYDGTDGAGGDRVAARHCAYRDRAGDEERVFGGSAVLMMLYANGDGVTRNLPLARRFACEYGGAPAEVRSRLAHLQRIEEGEASARFDICDDITSGYMHGMCSGRNAGFERHARDARWQSLQADWTPAQLQAWQRLRTAADGYFQHASSAEIDLSGTSRGAFVVTARTQLEVQLLEDVQRFEAGARPSYTSADLATVDRQLNAVYRTTRQRLQAGASSHPYSLFGTVDADGVRDTQRAWLRYREAWVAFAATRWPDTKADAWRAWLTDTRTAALEAITGDVDGATDPGA